ncbi:YbhB/YbcL family Raf kinase inhibitor-like protein [Vulcanisaeta sp. JCM 16159]|uniref:YbhB/YbcL family Raf kinase inhibitor-like protein n=1 Tax=Vulcanisaeta sp. JCM 16159 TaxID=1295371 RepID=UPI0006CF8A56|nr:YbhB/YbcL family Raf kinase inhibitor-like protein [Vulcanisaeta sp. JCM 16159]
MRIGHVIIVLILVMAVVMAVLLVIPTMHRASYVTIGLVKVPTNALRIIVSSVFSNGSQIPINYTCNGLDYSIPLYINDVPSNAKSLVIIMEDLNAPSGVFIHWVLYDVPPNITELPQGIPTQYYVPGIGYQGINDFGKVGYGGPCPPPGPPHKYVIIVLALNRELPPLNEDDIGLIRSINVNDIVGYGVLIGYYGG